MGFGENARRFVVVAIRDGREVAPTATGMPDSLAAAVPVDRAPADGFGPDPIQSSSLNSFCGLNSSLSRRDHPKMPMASTIRKR